MDEGMVGEIALANDAPKSATHAQLDPVTADRTWNTKEDGGRDAESAL
jgi:hypothetical protein